MRDARVSWLCFIGFISASLVTIPYYQGDVPHPFYGLIVTLTLLIVIGLLTMDI
jgi:hypothetical protein